MCYIIVLNINTVHVLLTKCLIRMREEESIQRQEEEKNQIRDQVNDKNCSSVFAPFVIQQA